MIPQTMRLLVLICCLSAAALMSPSSAHGATNPPSPIAVNAGGNHTCALTADGGIKCWGANGYGQVGDNSTTDRAMPMDVVGLSSGVRAIAVGGNHTCALTNNGGVKCWGYNASGQLGEGETTDRTTPVDVAGLSSGVSAITAGYGHTCALTTDGGVKCWGHYGQLPVDVTGLSSGVSAIAAGGGHTCALTTGGGVQCWGGNEDGQLGDGTTSNRGTPVAVAGLSSGVSAIAVGGSHSCALTEAGDVKCWGWNRDGQLGDGTTIDRSTPVDVASLPNGVGAIAAGRAHTCALTTEGGIKCWGRNGYGQLGDGTTNSRDTLVDVVGLSSGVSAITAGWSHTCALITAGGLKCWGSNGYSQLGAGTTSIRVTPVDVMGLSSSVGAIAAGVRHTCAVTSGGGVKCWGSNLFGRLGDGSLTDSSTPGNVTGLTSGVGAISTGGNHTCALTNDGGIKCWGYNASGQLGNNEMIDRNTPVDVMGLQSGVIAVTAGGYHTCALTTNSNVNCWGANEQGQLGDGTTSNRGTPVDVVDLPIGVRAISAGDGQTCALTAGGGLKCWGSNNRGRLGDGTLVDRSTPVDVIGLSSGVSAIAAGRSHTCALTVDGGVKCWGDNSSGRLGDGTTTDSSTPVNVAGLSSGVSAIAAGGGHTCALMVAGGLKCWGANGGGQLGDGSRTDRLTPVDVAGLSTGAAAIAAGGGHTCARMEDGGVKCWGGNRYGQLGVNLGWAPWDVTWLELKSFLPMMAR